MEAALCPICKFNLSQQSSSRIWTVRCTNCYLWAHTSIKYIRITSRFGFVKINAPDRTRIKESFEHIRDTATIIEETKQLWQYGEYLEWLMKGFKVDANPMPDWAFADWLGDMGLTHQEIAFRELMPELEKVSWIANCNILNEKVI